MLKMNLLGRFLMTTMILVAISWTAMGQQGQQLQLQKQKQKQSSAKVSDNELEKVGNILQQTQQVQQEYQKKMMEDISESGMDVQRFNEIASASNDPTKDVEASDKEMQQFKQAVEGIQNIRSEMRADIQKTIVAAGMEPQRFEEIMSMVKQDQEMQQRLRDAMQ